MSFNFTSEVVCVLAANAGEAESLLTNGVWESDGTDVKLVCSLTLDLNADDDVDEELVNWEDPILVVPALILFLELLMLFLGMVLLSLDILVSFSSAFFMPSGRNDARLDSVFKNDTIRSILHPSLDL